VRCTRGNQIRLPPTAKDDYRELVYWQRAPHPLPHTPRSPPAQDCPLHCATPPPPTATMANDEYDVSAACDTRVLVFCTDILSAVPFQGYMLLLCPS
jgi:hypothetical protein